MATATQAQKNKANDLLRAYVKQGAVFSSEVYQHNEWIFKARIPHVMTVSVVIGPRGALLNNWTV